MSALDLNKKEERKFLHGAEGYGVEVFGGSPEQREAVFQEHFGDPIVTVDARKADSPENLLRAALLEMAADEEKEDIKKMTRITSRHLRTALDNTKSDFVILEFDSLEIDAQRDVAQTMKATAEGLHTDEIMLGFTCEEGGAVVRAERDLAMRVRSWEIE